MADQPETAADRAWTDHGPSHITVFGLGGTIAMTDTPDGVAPGLTAQQLLASLRGPANPNLSLIVDVRDLCSVPSASLTFADIAGLAEAIRERRPQGAVVIQGTDTIEETAYLLDLLHSGPEPLVVTGAMRNPTVPGADGPANLLAAIQVATHPQARGQGCLVVFADEIHAARRIRKTHTTSTATFQSADGGPLGYLVEGQPRFLTRLSHRTVVPTMPADAIRVGLITMVLGEEGSLVEAIADYVDGVVVAAMGAGHVPASVVPALRTLAAIKPVVLASRTGSGSVLTHTYDFPGSELDLLGHGLISAGYLDPLKARVLLHTLLSADADTATIQTAFAVAGTTADPGLWPWPT